MTRLFVPILLFALAPSASAAGDIALNPGRHPTGGIGAFFSADGKTAVTLGSDRCVRVWDLDGGKQVSELWLPDKAGSQNALMKAWLSPDGKLLALPYYTAEEPRGKPALIPLTGPDRGTFRLIGGHMFEIDDAVFSPDGKFVATACKRPPIIVSEVATGKTICEIKYDQDMRASGMAFTPDGKKLTVALPMGNFDGEKHSGISTFDATTGKFLSEIPWKDAGDAGLEGIEAINAPRWSSDGKRLAVKRITIELLSADGSVKTAIRRPGELTFADASEFDSTGRFLVAWRKDGEYTVRDELAGKEITRFKGVRGRVRFSADGSRAFQFDDTTIIIHDLTGRTPVRSVRVAEHAPNALAWGRGATIAWGHGPIDFGTVGKLAAAIDLAQLKIVTFDPKDFTRARKEWGGVKLTDDGYRATATANGKALKLNYEPELDSDNILASTLAGPGHAVLSTGAGMFGYDTATGNEVCKYDVGGWLLAPAPDGKTFTAATWHDPLLRIYPSGSGDSLLTLYTVGNEWVAWTPKGAWASSDGAAKFAGTLSKREPGKLPTFVPLDPAKRDPAKVREAVNR